MTIENIYPSDTEETDWDYFANSVCMMLTKLLSAEDAPIMET